MWAEDTQPQGHTVVLLVPNRERGDEDEEEREEKRETSALLLNGIGEATGSGFNNPPLIDFTDKRWCSYRIPISVYLNCAAPKTTHIGLAERRR